jgi:hypothetical protein
MDGANLGVDHVIASRVDALDAIVIAANDGLKMLVQEQRCMLVLAIAAQSKKL